MYTHIHIHPYVYRNTGMFLDDSRRDCSLTFKSQQSRQGASLPRIQFSTVSNTYFKQQFQWRVAFCEFLNPNNLAKVLFSLEILKSQLHNHFTY